MGILLFACRLASRVCTGSIPITTLPVQHLPQPLSQNLARQIRKSSIPYLHFPIYSLDDEYAVEVGRTFECSRYLRRSVVWLVETETGRRIGFYSFRSVKVSGWSEDGRGFYVVDYIPGGGPILWDVGPDIPGYLGPAKVVLIPCRAPLRGVPLLPRLYWAMRCLFPEPHSPPAVWLPLVVLIAGLGGAGWGGFRWLRSPQGRRVIHKVGQAVLAIPQRLEDWLLGI